MIPKLGPSREAVVFACKLAEVSPDIFRRDSGARHNTYCRKYYVVRQRRRVWGIIRAVWEWSYPEIAYVTDSPNHSTVIDGLQEDEWWTPESLEALREWAHARFDALGPDAPALPDRAEFGKPEEPPKTAAEPAVVQEQVPRAVLIEMRAAKRKRERHGCDCKCSACVELTDLSRRLLARNPDLRVTMLEPMVRPFVRELQQRRAMGMTA